MSGAAGMLDEALDEEILYCWCGLALDTGQMFCGIDPACRRESQMEWPEMFES